MRCTNNNILTVILLPYLSKVNQNPPPKNGPVSSVGRAQGS